MLLMFKVFKVNLFLEVIFKEVWNRELIEVVYFVLIGLFEFDNFVS